MTILKLQIQWPFQQQQFVCQIKLALMQVTQARSSSKKSNRCARDSPDPKQKNNSYLIASKIGDFTQRNMTTCSRELDNRKVKNPADNTEYIRNLYKKYLGKENINNSDRKTKTDIKDVHVEKIMATEACRQKLVYPPEPELKKIESAVERPSYQPKMIRKLSAMQSTSKQFQATINYSGSQRRIDNFYDKILDNDVLNLIGNQKSSLVLAMQTINGIRKRYR